MNLLKGLVILSLSLISFTSQAQQSGSKTFYDATGGVLGSSRNYGSVTTYYDSLGSAVGRSANYSDAPMVSLLPYTPQPVQNDVEGAVARAYRTAYGDSSTSSYQPLFIFPHVPY